MGVETTTNVNQREPSHSDSENLRWQITGVEASEADAFKKAVKTQQVMRDHLTEIKAEKRYTTADANALIRGPEVIRGQLQELEKPLLQTSAE